MRKLSCNTYLVTIFTLWLFMFQVYKFGRVHHTHLLQTYGIRNAFPENISLLVIFLNSITFQNQRICDHSTGNRKNYDSYYIFVYHVHFPRYKWWKKTATKGGSESVFIHLVFDFKVKLLRRAGFYYSRPR